MEFSCGVVITSYIPVNKLLLLEHKDMRHCNAECMTKRVRLFSQGGLEYICATAERFFAVSEVLMVMVEQLPSQPSARLLKHIIRCYLRLSDNGRAREALKQCIPTLLMDQEFTACLKDDQQPRQYVPLVWLSVRAAVDRIL